LTIIFIWNGIFFVSMTETESQMFAIGISCKVLSNITWFLTALSNRSGTISVLFILASILLFWQRKFTFSKKFKLSKGSTFLIWIVTILVLPVFVYYLAKTAEYLSIYIFAFPFISWVDKEVKFTIRELLEFIL